MTTLRGLGGRREHLGSHEVGFPSEIFSSSAFLKFSCERFQSENGKTSRINNANRNRPSDSLQSSVPVPKGPELPWGSVSQAAHQLPATRLRQMKASATDQGPAAALLILEFKSSHIHGAAPADLKAEPPKSLQKPALQTPLGAAPAQHLPFGRPRLTRGG